MLSWPNIPRPPPKTWEVFQRMMIKTFVTMQRVYNPGAEMPLKVKMGKWLRAERHILYSMMRDGIACYEKEGERWRQYAYDNKIKQLIYEGEQEIDVSKCHPINGKVDE